MKATISESAISMSVTNESPIAVRSKKLPLRGLLMSLTAALGVMFPYQDARAAQKTLLDYGLTTPMINADIDSDAHGTVSSKLVRNEDGDSQRLAIRVGKLDPNTAYQLTAVVGDETAATNVAAFTTDNHGAFVLVYTKNRHGNALRGTQLLPALIDPLCNIRELDVVNADEQIVLHALLPVTSRRHYVVSRALQNSGVLFSAAGTLRITATKRTVHFRFTASGLTPSTDYILFANGGAGQTLTSDRAGKLHLSRLPQGFSNPLDIFTLGLSDMSGNLILSTGGLGIPCALQPQPPAPQAPVDLGDASGFAVLAGSTVTSSGFTIINNGDVGVSAGSAVEGFPPAVINNGSIHAADLAAGNAQLDLTTAYNDAKGRTLGPVSVAGNLGGRTLAPGLYKSTSSLEISSGDLTLNGQGDVNAVFIFQIASTLSTTSDRKVFLTGNAQAANVFWQVGTSATLGTGSVFKGTIMADQSITLTTGATLDGRALARIAGVTLGASTVNVPAP